MSHSLFNNQNRVPNEILMQIFNHLDSRSLNMAGQVSKRWRSVVEMVHDKAWRSLNKAVHLKPEFIGPKYKKIGWVEKEHSLNICKCINIARDLVLYDNIELMDADLQQEEKTGKIFDDDKKFYIIKRVEEANALIRLVAAGILTSLEYLTLADRKSLDWPVVKNLSLLVKVVHSSIDLYIYPYPGSGILPKSVFNHINCESLRIEIMYSRLSGFSFFTDADIESLNEALNDRVEKFQFQIRDGYGSFPIIEKYDGKGKCNEIELTYYKIANEEFGLELEFEKVKEWATSRGWNVEEYFNADEGFSRIVVHRWRKLDDLLDEMKQFEDLLEKALKKNKLWKIPYRVLTITS